jgi:hypothetical protein
MRQGLIIDKDGNKRWYQADCLHRTDGPAIEMTNGGKYWYQFGQLHRIDGPAIDWNDCQWYRFNRYRRRDGPVVFAAEALLWYYNGKAETKEENRRRLEDCLSSSQIWIPVETSGRRFPLVDLVLAYI